MQPQVSNERLMEDKDINLQAPNESLSAGTTGNMPQAPDERLMEGKPINLQPTHNEQPMENKPASMPQQTSDVRRPVRTNQRRDPVTYNIIEHIGKLSTSSSGWSREVNIVAWNGRQGRLDIRDWDPEHKKMSRGIGLNGTEVAVLTELLQRFDSNRLVA